MLWTESSDKTGVTLTCGVVGLPFAVSQSKRRSGPIVPAFSSWLGRGLGVPPAASLRTPQRQPAIAAGGRRTGVPARRRPAQPERARRDARRCWVEVEQQVSRRSYDPCPT